jgi:hypothetical protein
LEQLKTLAEKYPLYYKLINIKPKWGIDFSIDYAGVDGHTFEIFHYEWDSFNLEQVEQVKLKLEQVIMETDWDAAAFELMNKSQEWFNLDFFEQSAYKCKFFNLPNEHFKTVLWDWKQK